MTVNNFQPFYFFHRAFDFLEDVVGPSTTEMVKRLCVSGATIFSTLYLGRHVFSYPSIVPEIAAIGAASVSQIFYERFIEQPALVYQFQQIKEQSENNPKNVLYIRSEECRFTRNQLSCIRRIANTHAIEHKVISKDEKDEIYTYVRNLPNSRYNTVFFNCHGNPQGLSLGADFVSIYATNWMKILSSKLRRDARVVFESCRVGQGDDNFARLFSCYCPGTTVYASKTLYWPSVSLTVDDQGGIGLKNLLGIDITQIYKDDISLTP